MAGLSAAVSATHTVDELNYCLQVLKTGAAKFPAVLKRHQAQG